MKTIFVVACLAVVLLYPCTQAQILPSAFCSFCVSMFRFRGCLNNETPFCKLLAVKFKFKPLGQDVCEAFPCEGYGQNTGNSCTGLLSCPIQKILVRGICPLNRLCCKP